MLHSFVFLQFWSACSEQKLLAKQKYIIIITLTDVLSKAKLYFSLSFHWEKRKQEKTAEYTDKSKESKTEVIFVALYSKIFSIAYHFSCMYFFFYIVTCLLSYDLVSGCFRPGLYFLIGFPLGNKEKNLKLHMEKT